MITKIMNVNVINLDNLKFKNLQNEQELMLEIESKLVGMFSKLLQRSLFCNLLLVTIFNIKNIS